MARYIQKRRRKWYAVLEVPHGLRQTIGSARYLQSLGTESETVALRRAGPLVAQWKSEIAAAREGSSDPLEADIQFWRNALLHS